MKSDVLHWVVPNNGGLSRVWKDSGASSRVRVQRGVKVNPLSKVGHSFSTKQDTAFQTTALPREGSPKVGHGRGQDFCSGPCPTFRGRRIPKVGHGRGQDFRSGPCPTFRDPRVPEVGHGPGSAADVLFFLRGFEVFRRYPGSRVSPGGAGSRARPRGGVLLRATSCML